MQEIKYEDIKSELEKTIKEKTGSGDIVDKSLLLDVTDYIYRQLNSYSIYGNFNNDQFGLCLARSVDGLFKIVYVQHYKKGCHLAELDPFYISGEVLLMLLFTRIHNGAENDIRKLEIQAKQQINYIGGNR